MFGQRNKKRAVAQATMELTISMIILLILFAGMIRIFMWMGSVLVGRQNAYMKTYNASEELQDLPQDFYKPPRLDLFPG